MTLLEEQGLSTQPAEVGPAVRSRSPLVPLRRGWRQLTSMRTALLLLFLLALAAVPGGFLPQRSLNPVEVEEYVERHPDLAPALDALSLFDVFASPWFAAVYLLLFVSLVGCLVPRLRLHARALRTQPPKVPGNLARLPVSDSWTTDLAPQEAADAARSALRRRRHRTVARGSEVSAEKGYLRETGNLLFHVSLVVLLVGIALGGMLGFKGTVLVKEGDGFANAVFNYDDIDPGRRFDPDTLVPFNFTLDDFRATYTEDGKASTFDAGLTWAPGPDDEPRPYAMRVNHPLDAGGGAKVYLIGHGYAPRVVVKDGKGQVALDQAVPCLPQDPRFLSTCVVKVPDAQPRQLGFEGVFTPTTVQDPQTGQVTSVHPAADNPVLTLVGFRGDLGLDAGTPRSVYTLDKDNLDQVDEAAQALRVGETWDLPGGGSITFAGVTEWATFQVTQDPGKELALVASVGIVLGLLLSLFVRRRRTWVRVTTGADGRTVVQAGGLARTDPDAYAAEFDALRARLREATRGPAPETPTETPSVDREAVTPR